MVRGTEHLGRGHGPGRIDLPGPERRVGEGGVLDDQVARRVLDVVVGAEAERVVAELGRRVDPPALVSAALSA